MTSHRPLLAFSIAAAALLLGTDASRWVDRGPIAEAHAQDALTSCTLAGAALLPRGLLLHDAPRDGKPIAEFIGASMQVSLTIPEDLSARAKAVVTSGKTGLRIEGWLPVESIPVYAVKDVDAVGEQVKLAGGHRVKLVKGAKDRLTAELTIAGSQGQTLRGTGPCGAFSLDWALPSTPELPERARPFLMKTTSLDLFDKPGGENIYTLAMSEGASPLFHSVESRGMFQRVVSRSDVVIDAWVKLGTLTPIKKGDRIESPPTAPSVGAGSRMVLDSPPPMKVAPKDIPVRAQRDDKAPVVGAVLKGAEFYVMQVASGWANVLPRELNVSPASGGGFWVPEADLPR